MRVRGTQGEDRPSRARGRLLAPLLVLCCTLLAAIAVIAVPQGPSPSSDDAAPAAWTIDGDAEADGQADPAGEGDPLPEDPDAAQGIAAAADGAGGYWNPLEADVPEIAAEHEPDVVLVQLAEGVSADDLNAALAESGYVGDVQVTDEDIAGGFAKLPLADGIDVAHGMLALETLDVVQAAQPNFVYRLADDGFQAGDLVLPEEEGLSAQATRLNDPKAGMQWALESIHAYDAWDTVRGDGRVTVAVLDSGVMRNHEDLARNIVATYDATGTTGMDDVKNHGTHVAGIIAAEANNAAGVAGVSYNAGILPIQVFTWSEKRQDYVATTSDLRTAYEYVIRHAGEHGIKVVNMSIGGLEGETPGESADPLNYDDVLVRAVASATSAGILTVCAAGNDAETYGGAYWNYPSDYLSDALGVIALKDNPVGRAPYSNYNRSASDKTKDIAAPGTDILSTTKDGDYDYNSGTSMAAPCVAGVAALVFAANPDLTPAQVKGIICSTATDLGPSGWDVETGYGEVDAAAAVENAGVYLYGDSSVLKGKTLALEPSVSGTWTWTSDNKEVATVDSKGTVTGIAGGSAVITATSGGKTASKTVTVYDFIFDGDSEVMAGQSIDISCSVNPASGWKVASSDTGIATVSVISGSAIRVTGVAIGQTTITATLSTDSSISVSFPIRVVATNNPVSLGDGKAVVCYSSGWGLYSTYSGYFTGSAIEPVVVRYYPYGTSGYNSYGYPNAMFYKTLAKGIDYDIAYSNNVNVGTATAVITGKNSYTGTLGARFGIVARPITDVTVSGVSGNSYTGSRLAPVPLLTYGSYTLQQGRDFTVGSYEGDLVNVGSGRKMTVTGAGGFSGTGTLSFSITKADLSKARVSMGGWTYDGTAHTPAVTVTLDGRTVPASAYSVSYANNVNAGICTATVTAADTAHYTGSATGTCTVSPRSLSSAALSSIAVQYRTGGAIEPHPAVSWDGTTLAEGHDYTLSWSGNVNAGMATVTATGRGNYTGSASATFRIINAPTWSGATQLPVGATAAYTVGGGGSIRVISGGACVGLSGKTLSAKRAGTARLGLYDSLGRLYATRTVTVYKLSGNYVLQSSLSPSLVLDINGKSKKNGAKMIVWTRNGGKNQKFQFVAQSDGTYAIKCVHSRKYLAVKGGSKANGAAVVQWSWKKNAAHERWRITVDASNRLTFVNRASGKVFDVNGGRAVKGKNIIQWPSNNGANQKWVLKRS